MPYTIRKYKNKWQVINTETGDVKGTHADKAKAQRQIALLRGIEHGWEPTRK